MGKRTKAKRIKRGLIMCSTLSARLDERAKIEQRTKSSVVERAIALYLDRPYQGHEAESN